MRRRVLIVVSSYAPAMIADMHRARQMAWTMPQLGWELEILTPGTEFQREFCLEPDSEDFFPPGTTVHRASPLFRKAFDLLGMRSIGWRAFLPLLIKGFQVLRARRFDLVYISTTQFPLFLLGRIWRRFVPVPYVLDFHDPCYREGAKGPSWAPPSLKHRVAARSLGWIEGASVRKASGLVAVSPAYIDDLLRRYERDDLDWKTGGRNAAIPFGVLPEDFEAIPQVGEIPGNERGRDRTLRRIAYVGAGGPVMRQSFSMLCDALAALRSTSPDELHGLVFDLRGTHFGWREGDPRYLADLAKEAGVSEWVQERPIRQSYRASLRHLLECDGALVLGVGDGGYVPSKLFSYAWSGKPLLAILRRESPALQLFRKHPDMGHALWFTDDDSMSPDEVMSVLRAFLADVQVRRTYGRRGFLMKYTASEMARRHAELFDRCLAGEGQAPSETGIR
jgi:hypothetical protein